MLGFNHTMAGSIIALTVPAPIAPIVALASHFVLDAFPHFGRHPKFVGLNANIKRLIVVDGAICLAVSIYVLAHHFDQWFIICLCLLMANLPDLSWIFRKYLHTPQRLIDFYDWIQWGEHPWGWILDVLYGIIFAIILYSLS